MAWKYWMIAATGACAFTMTVGGAQSAPLGSAATDFRSSAAAETGFERIDYRRTYRNRARRAYGYRVYGYAGPRGYGYRRACPVTRRLDRLLRSGTSRLPYSPTVLLR